MKYPLKRYWVQICLLMLAFVASIYLRLALDLDPAVVASMLALSITAFIGSMNHYHDTDKFFKDLFKEFNDRYNEMNEFLNSIGEDQKLDKPGRQKVIDYLNLCAEEYMWVKKGRIPIEIWMSWKEGILSHVSKPPIKNIFDEELRLWKKSYYGFFEEFVAFK